MAARWTPWWACVVGSALGSACAGTPAPGADAPDPAPAAADADRPAAAPDPERPAAAPTAVAATPGAIGGDSPDDAAARLAAAIADEDVAAVVNLVEPTQRTGLAAMLGLMPEILRMLKPMIAMMANMGGDEGEGEEAAAAQAEARRRAAEMVEGLDAAIVEMDELRRQHGVDLPSMEALGFNPMAGAAPTEAELAAKVGDRFADVDAGAFVRDIMRVFDRLARIMPDRGQRQSPFDELKSRTVMGPLTDVVITGDTATATANGETARFLRVGGRWFIVLNDLRPPEDVPDMGRDDDGEAPDDDDEGHEREDR